MAALNWTESIWIIGHNRLIDFVRRDALSSCLREQQCTKWKWVVLRSRIKESYWGVLLGCRKEMSYRGVISKGSLNFISMNCISPWPPRHDKDPVAGDVDLISVITYQLNAIESMVHWNGVKLHQAGENENSAGCTWWALQVHSHSARQYTPFSTRCLLNAITWWHLNGWHRVSCARNLFQSRSQSLNLLSPPHRPASSKQHNKQHNTTDQPQDFHLAMRIVKL